MKKIPWFIKLFAIITFVGGLLRLLSALFVMTIGRADVFSGVFLMGVVGLLIALAMIVGAIGLLRMKLWSLYIFTGFTIIATTLVLYDGLLGNWDTGSLIDIGLQILITLDLWFVRKKLS